jgi:hypothetical protein
MFGTESGTVSPVTPTLSKLGTEPAVDARDFGWDVYSNVKTILGLNNDNCPMLIFSDILVAKNINVLVSDGSRSDQGKLCHKFYETLALTALIA